MEEIDYSNLNESKVTKKEVNAWIHVFITNYAPSYEQAQKFFKDKDIKITKADYDKICKKRNCKTI